MLKGMEFVINTESLDLGPVAHLLIAHRALTDIDYSVGDIVHTAEMEIARYHINEAYAHAAWTGCEATINEYSQWWGVDDLKAQKDRAFLAMTELKAIVNDMGIADDQTGFFIRSATSEIYAAAMNLLAAEDAHGSLLSKVSEKFTADYARTIKD
jgi:hypothetical protein